VRRDHNQKRWATDRRFDVYVIPAIEPEIRRDGSIDLVDSFRDANAAQSVRQLTMSGARVVMDIRALSVGERRSRKRAKYLPFLRLVR
jgi:hypothetical protein